MKRRIALILVALLCVPAAVTVADVPRVVSESPRSLQVAYDVDVVVVGGSTGAVSAAVAAAAAGAKVFLAAPRPYLGEDTAGTMRLWLEADETPSTPLAKTVFAPRDDRVFRVDPARVLPFKYQADRPSAKLHSDTEPPSRLCDGQWGSAVKQSVQYDGGAAITVDLLEAQALERAYVMLYHLKDFQVAGVTIHTSLDGKQWRQAAEIANDEPPQGSVEEAAITLSAPVTGEARYVKFEIRNASKSARVLLGEIIVVKPGKSSSPDPSPPKVRSVRPLQIKRALDEALLAAGVRFLYGSVATDVLRDETGTPAGIAMANRAGRQAVVAKVIIDATDRAWVARMAGAAFRPFPAGAQTAQRVVVGGEARTGEGMEARVIPPPFRRGSQTYDLIAYTLKLPLADGGWGSWAEAEQRARDVTYHPDQQFTSDMLFQVPPDAMKGQAQESGGWPGVPGLPLGAFQPVDVPHVFVLGGCADLPRDQAAKLLRPLALMDMGARIGQAAAEQAKRRGAPKGVKVTRKPGKVTGDAVVAGEVREFLGGVRPTQTLPRIPQEQRTLPVLGEYDVVVIGGGTSGAPAGIAAARQGAKTLVVEYLYGLGGVGTLGAISSYYWGNRVGFTKEVPGERNWPIEQRMEWWRSELRKAGGELWFGTLGCGALVDDGRVRGAVVATPEGRGVVLADVVIDATGNADVAAAAGAPCVYTDGSDIAMQGTGLPARRLGASYTNTDYTIVDETDMMDVWHVFVYAKVKAGKAFDLGQLIDTRERRRIVGDYTISVLDQVNQRTFPDTVVETYSNFDTHGYTIDPYFALVNPDKKGWRTHMPLRAFLPKGLEGILVVGLGVSAHRDAIPVIRMQPDIQNGGYAAGVAAAMAAKKGVPPRQIDVRALQRHLVKVGNLPESVLKEEDTYPMPTDQIGEAVASAKDGYKGVGILLAHPDLALPRLREAYGAVTSDQHKLIYAHILAVLGDETGLDALTSAVQAAPELGEGWHYKSAGQFGHNMSRLDTLIYALGCTGDRRALPALLGKLKLLSPEEAFSHHRAIALALEKIGDPAAAAPLAALLAKPGYRGHTLTTVDKAIDRERKSPEWATTVPRSLAIRELLLGRALYRCGDKDGIGRAILTAYTKDLRGHLARHAHAVLEGPKK